MSRPADLPGYSGLNTTRIYTCLSGTEQQRQNKRLGFVLKFLIHEPSVSDSAYETLLLAEAERLTRMR